MNRLYLFVLALLWGLPAWGQVIPPGTTGISCLASTAVPSLTDNRFAAMTCDLTGNLRVSTGASVTAGGTNGSAAQSVQGINGGVPVTTTTTRQVSFIEANNVAVAANALLTPTARTPGATYTKVNATGGCTAAGASLIVDGSSDGFSTYVTVATVSIAAGSRNGGAAGSTITAPVNFTSFRSYIANGATANTCSLVSSFTVN